jgi:hypothetical protein
MRRYYELLDTRDRDTMRCAIIAIAVLSLHSHPVAAAEELLLFGGAGHRREFSSYGWKNDFGKWSPYGQFASAYGSYSACNEFASEPPVIVDRQGASYGRLTINEFKSGSVCSALSNTERLCQALKVMCSSK